MRDKKTKLLSELTDVITKGTTPTTLGYKFQDEGINFLKIESFDGIGTFIPNKVAYVSDECHEKFKRSQLKKNDILFSIAGAIGRVAIVTEEMLPANTNQALAIIRLNDNNMYIPYVKLILTSNYVKRQIEKQKQGVAQINLSLKNIGDLEIPLIQYDEQVHFVNIFHKTGKILDQRKIQLQLLDDLIKSRFVEMFGDPITNSKSLPLIKLGNACQMKAGKNKKAADIFEINEDGLYPCFGGNGLRGYVSDYSHEGNIPLIGRQGALCGNVQYGTGQFYATEHAIVTQTQIGWNTIWLYIMLQEMNLNHLATGAAQPGINVSTLIPLEVINPDINLQNQYAEFVQKVDKLKLEVQKSLDETQVLFDSLMQEYFE